MSNAELRNMVMNFRVSDLQVLLGFAGRNKTGKKTDLQNRAMELLSLKSPPVELKVKEIHNSRYSQQVPRYEQPERRDFERPPVHQYESHLNNNYPGVRIVPRYTPNVRHSHSMSSSHSNLYAGSNHHPSTQSQYIYNSNHPAYQVSVRFKDLPFYDNLHCIMQPTCLPSKTDGRFQEETFYFTLTLEQAQEVSMSRKNSEHSDCQVLLRFGLMDPSCEQEDFFPQNVTVKLNSKDVPLPNPFPNNKPGVEPKRPSKPVNVTNQTKLSPTVTNVVHIRWTSTYGRSYVVGLFVCRRLTSELLLQRLKESNVRDKEYTTNMIKEKLQQGLDAEIATTTLRLTLICPLGKIRMEFPCRSVLCSHLQCFEALLYIQMNEKKPKWICPICDQPAPLKTLSLDGLLLNITREAPASCTEVEFHENGSWTPVVPLAELKDAKKVVEKKQLNTSVEIVEIASDSDPEDWTYKLDQQTVESVLGDVPSVPPSQTAFPNPPEMLLPDIPQTYSSSFNQTEAVHNNPLPLDQSSAILPDLLVPDVDPSLPSSTGVGMNSSMPFFAEPYFPPPPSSEQNGTLTSSGFDFMSLLPPTHELELPGVQERNRIAATTPDVIALD